MGNGGKGTTDRGLGWEHQRVRKALLPRAYGTQCPICGELMLKGQALDLDHSVPRALGGNGPRRMAHASCNRKSGAKLGNMLRSAKRVPSRW